MTNAEKNKDKLREVGYSFSVTKNGEIDNCGKHDCIGANCKFYKDSSCLRARINWLLEDTKQSHNEVVKILDEAGGRFGINKDTEEVFDCTKNITSCRDCDFNNRQGICADFRFKWLREHGFIKEE